MEHGSVKDYGVFIGRFEPFHIGHKAVVEVALKENNKLIILVGSAKDHPREEESVHISLKERNDRRRSV
jgi:cytidyltransferase-like protein